MMENFECGDYFFTSKFDSGNLGRVELVRNCPDTEITENIIHAEYNVWTTPDCFGTRYENPNRTWFFFSIRGGRAYRNVKLNVKNLNRQAKLFSQGMQPVMRIGLNGKWERIKNKPTYSVDPDNFTMSFIHHAEKSDVDYFYAFTYPFTYTECQNMLEKFDEKYQKSVHDIKLMINRLLSLKGVTVDKPQSSEEEALVCSEMITIQCSNEDDAQTHVADSIYCKMSEKELLSDVYYHRDLLVNSMEGRRCDLITITSFHGIQDEMEENLSNIFPDQLSHRCHVFKDKKIVFLSSRVHPGETPASFVLNGFLKLLLDRKSNIAATLRQFYVFKIVPLLNPDGVYNGLYRTDTMGHNLNRMYMSPKIEIHPTIYAVKKLIRYYHYGYDKFDEENERDTLDNVEQAQSTSTDSSLCQDKSTVGLNVEVPTENLHLIKEGSSVSISSEDFQNQNLPKETSSDGSECTGILVPTLKPITSEPAPKKTSLGGNFTIKSSDLKMRRSFKSLLGLGKHQHPSTSRSSENRPMRDFMSTGHARNVNKKVGQRKEFKAGNANKSSFSLHGNVKTMNKKNILSNHNIIQGCDFASRSDNICDMENVAREEHSNMFLYIDFHGHASKKGVFMYGNYFANSAEAVECMLLPRVMSINCHHFHYDACNFSERNMYRREKRDGLSKEGSGRVAVYKMTGLIKSYTLECNYNTGKYVNILPARNKDTVSKATKMTSPPKYSPAHFEEVGRALGPSILDLTNSNQLTRLPNSDFRSLQGLRLTLRSEIDRAFTRPNVANVIGVTSAKVLSPRQNVKQIKCNLAPSTAMPPNNNDFLKENKVWNISGPVTSSSLSRPAGASTSSKLPLRIQRIMKKQTIKVRQTTNFEKKDTPFMKNNKKSALNSETSSNIASSTSINTACGSSRLFQVPPKKVKVTPRLYSAKLTTKTMTCGVLSKPGTITSIPSPKSMFSTEKSTVTAATENHENLHSNTSAATAVSTGALYSSIENEMQQHYIQPIITAHQRPESTEKCTSDSGRLCILSKKTLNTLSVSLVTHTATVPTTTAMKALDISLPQIFTDISSLSSSVILPIKVTSTQIISDSSPPVPVPVQNASLCCSRTLSKSNNKNALIGFRKTKKAILNDPYKAASSFASCCNHLKSSKIRFGMKKSLSTESSSDACGTSDLKSKLLKKKRIVRHDSLVVKRKKNKNAPRR